jgi:heme/copper-type cytochrome/quinol oxidase subunit 2
LEWQEDAKKKEKKRKKKEENGMGEIIMSILCVIAFVTGLVLAFVWWKQRRDGDEPSVAKIGVAVGLIAGSLVFVFTQGLIGTVIETGAAFLTPILGFFTAVSPFVGVGVGIYMFILWKRQRDEGQDASFKTALLGAVIGLASLWILITWIIEWLTSLGVIS